MSIAMSEHGERRSRAYGFVNMISDAPRVQRVRCECRYVRAGRIPHVRGSSSLEQWQSRIRQQQRGTRKKKKRTSRGD